MLVLSLLLGFESGGLSHVFVRISQEMLRSYIQL